MHPRCFVALLPVSFFLGFLFSFHLPLHLSLAPLLPPFPPTSSFSPFLSHWWFVFLSGGISGSHSVRTHYSPLIHSRGWAPGGRMGDWGVLSPPPSTSSPSSPSSSLLAMRWCHGFLFAPGVPIDSLSSCVTRYISSFPSPSWALTPVFLSRFVSKPLRALNGSQRIWVQFDCGSPWQDIRKSLHGSPALDAHPSVRRTRIVISPVYRFSIHSWQPVDLVLRTQFVK